MAHDYEDLHDISDLTDGELSDLIRERLREQPTLDISGITVHAKDGAVVLRGSVGTDEERSIAEHVLTDVLGVERLTNDLLVQASRRAPDDETEDDSARDATRSQEMEVALDGMPQHRADSIAAELEGTTDYETVMEEGATWNPPNSPTPEGFRDAESL